MAGTSSQTPPTTPSPLPPVEQVEQANETQVTTQHSSGIEVLYLNLINIFGTGFYRASAILKFLNIFQNLNIRLIRHRKH